MSDEDFSKWRLSLGCNSLLFDGSSKGNPGLAGARGVIFYLGGSKLKDYAWAWVRNQIMGLSGLLFSKGWRLQTIAEWRR